MADSTVVTQCIICSTTRKLRKCQGCHVVSYCGRDHQAYDWGLHKMICKCLKKLQDDLHREEERLRSLPGDGIRPEFHSGPVGSLFEEAHEYARFWEIPETQEYMTIRQAMVQGLLEIKTLEAVQAAQRHCTFMIWVNPPDDLDIRDIVMPLYIRLGAIQRCYDELKWCAEEGSDPLYDWGRPRETMQHIEANRDILEDVNDFLREYVSLSLKVAVTLIKVTFLLQVQSLRNAAILSKRLPQEIVDCVGRQAVNRDVLKKKEIMDSECHESVIKKLEMQIRIMYVAVKRDSPQVWSELLKPRQHIPKYVSARQKYRNEPESVQAVVRYNYFSWIETPGALEVIKDLAQHFDTR
ncbi:hypothetical protein EDD37DRAFT_86256 [Exophiala viscosa]|uniref:uncharacterized protein n=1 Tax=Exophiala viscosa TaxID=2486360 RepID=UPI00218CFA02|nr:hypothetical protein EDD37DRAFT_86256 [Exophiala viscosa]